MLNYKIAKISFYVVLCLLISMNLFSTLTMHWWYYILLGVVYFSLIFYGSYYIQSGFFLKAYSSGATKEKEIAITFDDGPVKENTSLILDLLKEFNVKATFFLIGKHIKGNEDLIKRMDAEGHTVGNHSYSHSYFFDFFSTNKIKAELEETQNEVERVINKKMKFFRPPFGVTTPSIRKAVDALKFSVIGWNIRSLDGTEKDENKILDRIIKRLQPGAIILLHDTNPKAVIILRALLTHLTKNGYKIVGLDQILNLKSYE